MVAPQRLSQRVKGLWEMLPSAHNVLPHMSPAANKLPVSSLLLRCSWSSQVCRPPAECALGGMPLGLPPLNALQTAPDFSSVAFKKGKKENIVVPQQHPGPWAGELPPRRPGARRPRESPARFLLARLQGTPAPRDPAKRVILPEPWDHCLVPGWCNAGLQDLALALLVTIFNRDAVWCTREHGCSCAGLKDLSIQLRGGWVAALEPWPRDTGGPVRCCW